MNDKTQVIAMIKNMWMPRLGGISGYDEILLQQARDFVPAWSRNRKS